MMVHVHCGGLLVLLGTLGNLRWYRCRNCGMQISRKAPKHRKKKEAKMK